MSDELIYNAFCDLVIAFAAEAGLTCAYPAVAFTPPSGCAWLELQWHLNQTQNYGTSDTGPSLRQGFAQLSVCYRPGTGIGLGLGLSDRIIAAFGKGTTFAGMRVHRKPWAGGSITDPTRIMQPVTIPWRGFDTVG